MKLKMIIMLLCLFIFSSCSPSVNNCRVSFSPSSDRGGIISTAQNYLGVKYRYGGVSPSGFDCSGLVQYVYRKNGINLPRSTRDQYCRGKRVSRSSMQPADLVFFHTGSRRISHVGIYAGNGRFIHAPRTGKRVSYARMDNSYWKKRFVGAVSYLSSARKYREPGEKSRSKRRKPWVL